jgi:hypothetical protein
VIVCASDVSQAERKDAIHHQDGVLSARQHFVRYGEVPSSELSFGIGVLSARQHFVRYGSLGGLIFYLFAAQVLSAGAVGFLGNQAPGHIMIEHDI